MSPLQFLFFYSHDLIPQNILGSSVFPAPVLELAIPFISYWPCMEEKIEKENLLKFQGKNRNKKKIYYKNLITRD